MKLLAYRKNDGLGDWMMAMSVLKMVNQQYPDIDIDVHVEETTDEDNARQHRFLQGVYDIIDNVDVKLTKVFEADKNHYDYYTGHMLYPTPLPRYDLYQISSDSPKRKHLIHGMIDNFNEETSLDLKYDEKVLAQFIDIVPFSYHKPYVVMPSCGRNKDKEHDGKWWVYKNYSELAKRLREHYSIIQIGSSDQPILDDVDHVVLGRPLKHVLGIMKESEFYVGEINGMIHLAGHHGIPAYAIYCGGGEHPEFTGYKNQIPTWGKTVEHVYITIKKEE